MKKILITGANGYIGSFLKKNLQKKYNVKTLGRSDNNDYKINILNKKKLFNLFKRKKFFCIIHCAANVPGKKILLNKKHYVENHICSFDQQI